ncbi:hypothetical protein B2A_11348 [mine drainage metagenome]|uniref:Uncharacterized protein n=1 Tax=mine drainage metagenome TaxID=410659 RepID=T0YT35_9ZZZZ
MNESIKVQPHHLERGAYLYIRQSSMRQVIENVESTKRQYALRVAQPPSVGAMSKSSSSTATRASPVPRRPGAKVFSAW